MMDAWAASLGSGLLAHAADAALRSLALALLTSIVLVWARRKDATLPLVIWRAVLYSALAMPLMVWLMPSLSVPVPLAASKPQVKSPAQVVIVLPASQTATAPVHAAKVAVFTPAEMPQTPNREIPWKSVATAIYVVVAGILLARLAVGWILSGRLKRRSRRIEDPKPLASAIELSRRLAIRHAPELAESSAIAAPVTLGVRRPVILLPAAWSEWEQRKLRAVLAHELSHVARRDALTQALAAVHRSVFWFSPLGWWLERHLALLAEEASDDFALNEVSDRDYYAQILVDFLSAVVNARGRISWQGVSMAKGTKVERRVDRILSGSAGALRRLEKPAWAAILLVAAPLACLTAAVRPVSQQAAPAAVQAVAPPPEPAAAPVPAAAPRVSPVAQVASARDMQDQPAPPAPPAPPAAPAAVPQPPAPPQAPAKFQWTSKDTPTYRWYSDDDKDGEAFVIVSGDSLTMSGGRTAAQHAKSLKSKIAGDFIWFQHDGKGYVIRDAATVRQAQEFFAQQDALGRQQDELGKKQDELGRKMDEIGKQMEQVHIQVPDLTAELRQIEAQLAKLQNGATMEQLGNVQSQLGEVMGKLGALQGQAGSQQGKLGKMQSELGQQQALLGQTQSNLGAEQSRLAREAQRNMKTLLDESIKSGKAKPE